MKALLFTTGGALLGSMLSFAVVGYAQVAKTPSAVAFVSANRVLTESVHGRSEAARLLALQQQRAADLRAKQQTLEATRQALAKAVDDAAKIEWQQKELQQRTDLERAAQQAQADYQSLQRQINADLQQRLKSTLDDLLKTQGYQLVLNSDTALVWVTPDLDLTPAVVAKMNDQP